MSSISYPYKLLLTLCCLLNCVNSLRMSSSISNEMRILCEGLSRDLLSTINDKKPTSQYWVAVSGGPGAGKSTISSLICESLNNLGMSTVVIPMDGYHYSRAQLQEIAKKGEVTYDELLTRRGAEWTFDAEKFVIDVTKAKENGSAMLPVYSRIKSDPVDNGVELLPTHKIVLVEGNYILNWDQDRWSPLKVLFDEKWFISCTDLQVQRERLVARHLETWTTEKERLWGFGIEGATRKANSNDVLNAEFVETTSKKYADRIIINF